MTAPAWAVEAAKRFAKPERRWATPGAMAVDLDPLTRQTPALDLIDRELVALADGKFDRLAISMPPQEGKSQRAARRYALWLLCIDPTLRIGIVSYESESAVRWGRAIKRDVDMNPDLGISIRQDSRAAGRWETEQGGGIVCAGITGAITGKPIDVLIIDDPVKDRAAAESKTLRDTAWDFWENVGKLRLSSRGKVVLIMTRWHHDDLAGRLEENEPGEWRTVRIPAIADAPDDPLGRQVGEEMVSAQGRKPGYFRGLMSTLSNYVWLSLMQQRPTSAGGGIFKRGDWQYWDALGDDRIRLDGSDMDLRDATKFITIDLATSTKTSADYTVASAWAIMISGDIVLLDRIRERVPEVDHAELIAPLRQRWLGMYDVTYIESRMFGTTLVYALGRAGVPVSELEADKDKLTRALPYAGLVRQHKVWLPRSATWLDVWLDEHADFPNTAHDDQVDTGAYAARIAIAHWLPMQSADMERAIPRTRELDFETIPY